MALATLSLATYPAHPAFYDGAGGETIVTLDPNRQYEVQHTGLDAGGTAATDEIWINTDGTTTPDGAGGTREATLIAGVPVYLGPGLTTIKMHISGGAPCATISPIEIRIGQY